jgi:hypothetical protein
VETTKFVKKAGKLTGIRIVYKSREFLRPLLDTPAKKAYGIVEV